MKSRLPSLRADIEGFIAHRQQRWSQLESLLGRLASDPRGGGRARVVELMRLYRLASSDLNQARAITANPELLARLNQLVGRAYRIIYQAPPASAGAGVWATAGAFLMRMGPAAFQRQRRWVAIAGALLLAGVLIGAVAVLVNPANGEAVIPRDFFTQSPAERVEHVEMSKERIDTAQKAAAFGAMLYTHNIQVAFLVFSALGALTVVGAGALLFYNGMLLGAIAMLYYLDGVGTFFIAWVGPHGSLGAAVDHLRRRGGHAPRAGAPPAGRAGARRGPAPRGARRLHRMLGVAAITLVMAGLIEGSFSQFSSKSIPYALKIAVAAALFSALCAWLFLPRRGTQAP